jgi:RNA polymerase sigma factor (sigma-70 family)
VSLDLDLKSDADLIAAVREGDTASYGVLYERHLQAAKRAASCLANSTAEREDLVADAFTRVLRALRDGGGPKEEFRAYLLVTMRNAAISSFRGASVSLYADMPETFMPRAGGDPVVNKWDAMTAAAAFASLPERWRTVLWHTEVEDESPAEIAPLLGMRPNGVAALAYRAREGLRQAYLREHLPNVESRECQATVAKLAGWVRRSVPIPLGRKISKHLAVCADCRARVDTLTRVNEELRAVVAPLLLGASFAAAYVPVTAAASGAAGAVAVKSLLAKVAVVAVIAATAVTTMASAPHAGDDSGVPAIPALAEPTEATDSIDGPNHPRSSDLPAVSAPVTTTTVPGAPVEPEAASEDSTEVVTTTTDTTATDAKAAAKAAKEAAKAEKKAAKESTKAEKEAAKESRKAEKGK